jgi:hypothetical protein
MILRSTMPKLVAPIRESALQAWSLRVVKSGWRPTESKTVEVGKNSTTPHLQDPYRLLALLVSLHRLYACCYVQLGYAPLPSPQRPRLCGDQGERMLHAQKTVRQVLGPGHNIPGARLFGFHGIRYRNTLREHIKNIYHYTNDKPRWQPSVALICDLARTG